MEPEPTVSMLKLRDYSLYKARENQDPISTPHSAAPGNTEMVAPSHRE